MDTIELTMQSQPEASSDDYERFKESIERARRELSVAEGREDFVMAEVIQYAIADEMGSNPEFAKRYTNELLNTSVS